MAFCEVSYGHIQAYMFNICEYQKHDSLPESETLFRLICMLTKQNGDIFTRGPAVVDVGQVDPSFISNFDQPQLSHHVSARLSAGVIL
jgi:uncharacterized protein (DUF488 family)